MKSENRHRACRTIDQSFGISSGFDYVDITYSNLKHSFYRKAKKIDFVVAGDVFGHFNYDEECRQNAFE